MRISWGFLRVSSRWASNNLNEFNEPKINAPTLHDHSAALPPTSLAQHTRKHTETVSNWLTSHMRSCPQRQTSWTDEAERRTKRHTDTLMRRNAPHLRRNLPPHPTRCAIETKWCRWGLRCGRISFGRLSVGIYSSTASPPACVSELWSGGVRFGASIPTVTV